jgi:hypothetical protein
LTRRTRRSLAFRGSRAALPLRSVALVVAAVALLVVLSQPSFTAPGWEMDEGLALAYPSRILEGGVPHRDFETFHGPGAYWLLAGAFKAFGPTLVTERAVALGYRCLLLIGVFLLTLGWGRLVAACCASVTGALLLGTDLSAGAALGASALAVLGLGLLVRGSEEPRPNAGNLLALAAGLASGAAILFRFDFAPAVIVGIAVLFPAIPRGRRRFLVAGAVLGVLPYVPHVLVVGLDQLERVAADLRHAAPGRHLPIPPPTGSDGQLFWAQAAAGALLTFAGALGRRHGWRPIAWRAVLAAGLFVLALQPYAFSRADPPHFIVPACVGIALLPLLARVGAGSLQSRLPRAVGAVAPAVTALLVVGLLAPESLRRPLEDQAAALTGADETHESYEVRRGERSFRLRSERDARAVSALLRELDRRDLRDHTIFVGPRDLRRTNYADTYLYYLLPETRPASFFMELGPQTANRPDSRLATELRTADFVVLNARWDKWDEPNASSEVGSPLPNDIVRRLFCKRWARGTYTLHERCRRG